GWEIRNAIDPLLRTQRVFTRTLRDVDGSRRAVRGAPSQFPQVATHDARVFASQSQAQGAGARYRRGAAHRECCDPNLDRSAFSGGKAASRGPDAGIACDLAPGLVRVGHSPLPFAHQLAATRLRSPRRGGIRPAARAAAAL